MIDRSSVLSASPADLVDVFQSAAKRIGANPVHVEKDFWVCYTLDALYNRAGSDVRLLFKGGTSLSKAWNLINRFSEDVDVTVFRGDVGFDVDSAGLESLSSMKRRALLEHIRTACRDFVRGPLADRLDGIVAEDVAECGLPPGTIRIERDTNDPDAQSLFVAYRSVLPGGEEYVDRRVLIESGAKSAVDPHATVDVVPYVAPDIEGLDVVARGIVTIEPKRTFGDKAVILHGINSWLERRGEVMRNGNRLSRHVYDMHCLLTRGVADEAMSDDGLVESCVRHARMFFNRSPLGLEAARPGSFAIAPRGELRTALRRDYDEMRAMIFGDPPAFDDMMASLAEVEERLNDAPAFSP